MRYYLAIDIGASSGRHILGSIQDGKLCLEEIYRFDNRQVRREGHDCWDLGHLWKSIVEGLKMCKAQNKIPTTVGIDTWAVDYVLLDGEDKLLGDGVAYRDGRTQGMDDLVHQKVSQEELYRRTGIQKQIFNTIYQLEALSREHPEQLAQAKSLLMLPDYFNFLLTGVKHQEYTNATSTSLVNAHTRQWDGELLDKLGLPRALFGPLSMPGTVVGPFTPAIRDEVGFDATVILPATHDTGSAFLAVPARDDQAVYLSSGTWSLLGVENEAPITTPESQKANFTNEGGAWYRFRYLKNIMGLWMIQSIRRELNGVDYVAGGTHRDYCRRTGQQVPETVGEIMECEYRSLARRYAQAIEELQGLTGKTYTSINIVGGGCQDGYLNALTAQATGLPVFAGPVEGTAIGNLVVQLIADGVYANLQEAREAIGHSFEIQEVKP